ncbi:sucrase/ferredoxin domain-containing protein [Decorospora gaudefroyi]|uniref:Defect at low temperature protein 1 n=1 Tax=Decorospora gaudefroyi TaxID=184978 RepID=A0A6A5KDJ7_9PLEO|nr:sucrase/ferredoxin domain-containing protein [Decorospora gaudefroyi]
MRIPLFRIWYSTTYTTLLIVLILLLAITPADTIYQSIKSDEIQKLFVIGGVYLLTCLIVLLIYSTRIYTNRTVLAAIPKGYVPIEEGEVGKGVRRMIVKHLKRSAVIAWDSRPRDVRAEVAGAEEERGDESRPNTAGSKKDKEKNKDKDKAHKKKSHPHAPDGTIIPVSVHSLPWGRVSHPGWASPSSPDLPNLQYWSVICELPNLIEAKAVSLAPPDPALEGSASQHPDNAPALPDAHIVTLLQRPRAMGLREYLARLAEFGLLNPPSLGPTFLAHYEYARFSTASLTETQFRDLMFTFAEILGGMTRIDPDVLEETRAQSIASDTRSLAPTESSSEGSTTSSSHVPYRTPQLDRQPSLSSFNSSTSSRCSNGTTHSPQTARTAPSRQQLDLHPTVSESDTGSIIVHQRQQRSPSTLLPNSSESSLGSVIRLHPNPSEGELPYQYNVDGG